MKKLFLLLALLASLDALAQTEVYMGFSVWSQRMDLSQYIGKNYRLTMAIRAEPSKAESAAFGFIRNEYPKIGHKNWVFMDNMNERPVTLKNWGTYTLENTVDVKAPWLGFGMASLGNGNFYCDQVQLFIETEPGIWAQVPIPNGDFEGESLEPWMQTSQGVPTKVYGAKAELSSEKPFEGRQCLKVTNKGLVKN